MKSFEQASLVFSFRLFHLSKSGADMSAIHSRHHDVVKRYTNLGFLSRLPSDLVFPNARKYNRFEVA